MATKKQGNGNGSGTGLTKVGVPAATQGLLAEDPTIAELLENHG